jgi:putative ABC transport system permease protein
MLRLAVRNLFQSQARLVISAGGVALALLLILALDAIFSGVERQITAYIDNSDADVFVSQSGVRNLHMSASSLPASVARRIQAVPGVQEVTSVGYLTNMVVTGEERHLAYVIGLPADAAAGKPWQVEGAPVPAPGEAVIDRGVAEKSGLGIGDSVEILGEDFTIAGLSQGTASLVNSVAFVALRDMGRLRGDAETVSFVLVQVDPAESPETVAARIEARVSEVTAQPRPAFAEQERRTVRDMGTDLITIMNLVGFLIGLAVMALTVYTAILSRRQEYGGLKALGARNAHLYRAVLAQALISVVLGFVLGVALTFLLAVALPILRIDLVLEVRPASLLKAGAMSLVIAGLSAVLPVRQIARLDPAAVFRRR